MMCYFSSQKFDHALNHHIFKDITDISFPSLLYFEIAALLENRQTVDLKLSVCRNMFYLYKCVKLFHDYKCSNANDMLIIVSFSKVYFNTPFWNMIFNEYF